MTSSGRVDLTGLREERHGTVNGYVTDGCRCVCCREAMLAYTASRPIKEHGKRYAYTCGCRCALCCAANTEYARARYIPAAAVPEGTT